MRTNALYSSNVVTWSEAEVTSRIRDATLLGFVGLICALQYLNRSVKVRFICFCVTVNTPIAYHREAEDGGKKRAVTTLLTQKAKTPAEARVINEWCPDSESNQGHGDFQSPALPTELSGQRGALNPIHSPPSTKNVVFVTDCTISHQFVVILSEKVGPQRGKRHGEQQGR